MDQQPAGRSSHNLLFRLWPWLLVLAAIIFVGFIRIRLLEIPLERDEGEYAYAGQLILQGLPPYELAYNMKLPGTYFAYAAGMSLFGQTIAGVHLTLLVANSLTIVLMFLLGRKLFGDIGGLVTCASYAVMSISPAVAGLAAHATHFVVLFAVAATLLLLKASEIRRRDILFFSGLFYGLAFLMKQPGVFFGLFGGAFLMWQAAHERNLFSREFIKTSLAFGMGTILPLGLTCLVLALAGVFREFWFWTFTYAHSYVTATPLQEGVRLLHVYCRDQFDLLAGFGVILALGLPPAFFLKETRRGACLTVLLGVCSFLGTATGLYFRPHYFILMLPAFALMQGMAVVSLQRALGFGAMKNVLETLPVILFATAFSWAVFYQSRIFFQLSPVQACESLYNWNPFVESLPAARYIREHSTPADRIAVMGSEPQIYFYAQRRSATGYIYTYALMEPQPNALKMQGEMRREIEAVQPDYLVYVSYSFSWIFHTDSNRSIIEWFDNYAERFYDRVGLVQMNSSGGVDCIWDDAAKNLPKPAGAYLAIYKRKPGSEIHHDKSYQPAKQYSTDR